jgi:hypothetical protein
MIVPPALIKPTVAIVPVVAPTIAPIDVDIDPVVATPIVPLVPVVDLPGPIVGPAIASRSPRTIAVARPPPLSALSRSIRSVAIAGAIRSVATAGAIRSVTISTWATWQITFARTIRANTIAGTIRSIAVTATRSTRPIVVAGTVATPAGPIVAFWSSWQSRWSIAAGQVASARPIR